MPLLLRCRFNEYADNKFMYNSPPLPNGVLRKIVRKDRELEHQKISSHAKLIILNKKFFFNNGWKRCLKIFFWWSNILRFLSVFLFFNYHKVNASALRPYSIYFRTFSSFKTRLFFFALFAVSTSSCQHLLSSFRWSQSRVIYWNNFRFFKN